MKSTGQKCSKLYKDAFIPMQTASASNQVVALSPRFGVEALGMVLIAGLAYMLASASGAGDGVAIAIPVLGALALGAQRLLPVLQQIYTAYIERANVITFDEATSALDNETEVAVMQAAETLGRGINILIIVHMLTTLKNCGQIVESANCGINAVGGYEPMMRWAA